MRHILFEESEDNKYSTAILIKSSSFSQRELKKHYVDALVEKGIQTKDVIAFDLSYDNAKVSAKHAKEYLSKLLPALVTLGVTHIYVADATYFKILAGVTKAEPSLGYVLPCKMKGFEQLHVCLGVNHQQMIYDPSKTKDKLELSLVGLCEHINGGYKELGMGIIHSAVYPDSIEEIESFLESLHQHPELTADIEAFSLKHWLAGLGTVAFAWDKHNGGAFKVSNNVYRDASGTEVISSNLVDHLIFSRDRANALKKFFSEYKGKITWHNSTYDLKILIFFLWMNSDPENYVGMLEGLEIMTRHFDDTKIIAYLATNSTAGNVLGLKVLAHEFAGHWALDVEDIRTIPVTDLLEYNLIDCLSTWYVKDKHKPIMVADQQEEIYETLFKPSLKTIIQMELVGMPMKEEVLNDVSNQLLKEVNINQALVANDPVIQTLNLLLQTSAMEKANAKLKTKQHGLDKFQGEVFNPGSFKQLQKLLYEQLGLPIIDYTKTRQPATGAETIAKLIHHTDIPEYKSLLQNIIDFSKVNKILNTFIPAFYGGMVRGAYRFLHGSFNLGGTVSGRLSSSDPNMQNLPANSKFGNLIKTIFQAPKGDFIIDKDKLKSVIDSIN